jgi:hypothetical protein
MKYQYTILPALIAILVACNQPPPPPPPGWNLELRAGTTNIDRSFFQSVKPDTTRSSVDETRFQQLREAIVKKVPNLNLGSALASGFVQNPKATKSSTRETYGLALSLFMVVTKDGAVPNSDLSFVYNGPKGAYDQPITYKAGQAWLASPLVIPKGSGNYTFSSTLQDGTLTGNVNVNLEDQTQWLPLPQSSAPIPFGSMGQYANVFLADWQVISGAQSYLGLIYDRTDKKYVGTFLTKSTRIETQEFNGVQDHSYSLDLIATTIDLTKDDTKPYGILPDSVKSSISSFGLDSLGQTPFLAIDQKRVILLAKPNQFAETTLKIRNVGLVPLGYTATISGTGFELTTGAKGVLARDETRDIHIKGMCTGDDLTAIVNVISNDPNNKTKTIPVVLECDTPVSVTLELAKVTHNARVNLIERSPDGTKMATSDGADILIWDAITGNMIRKITPVNNSGSNGLISSFAWHPNNKLLLVGRTNIVDVLDTSTGLSIATSSPPGSVGSLDWNVDGSKFVVGVSGGARIYDGLSGGLMRQIQMPNPSYSTIVTWSKSSNKLATLNGDRVSVWDNETGIETNHYQGSIPNYNFQAVSPGSLTWNSAGDKLIFLIPSNENIGVWSIPNPTLELTIPVEIPNSPKDASGNFSEIKQSPIDSKIAIISRKRYSDGTTFTIIRIWNSSSGNFLTEFPIQDIQDFEFFPRVLTWSSDGQSLLVQAGNMIQSWNASTGARGMQLGFVTNGISSIHFNNDATQLLASTNLPNNGFPYSLKGSLNLLNVPSGIVLPRITTALSINSVDWSKNTNQILAIFDYNGGMQTYAANSLNPLTTLTGYAPSVYNSDGTKLAVSQNDSTVRILDTSKGSTLQTIAMKTCTGCGAYSTQSLAWSPDGSKIAATASNSPLQQVYDVTNGQLFWGKSYNYNSQDGLHWSPDGKSISYGSAFLDATTGDLVEVFDSSSLTNVSGLPVVLAWSPNNQYVLTKIGNSIELRNAHSGRKILSLLEIPQQTNPYSSARVVADWNVQSNRFAVTDGQSSVYIYKFSQP